MRNALKVAIMELAEKANASAGAARWYWFGSSRDRLSGAVDIDLLVICESDTIADKFRSFIDLDQLARPIHLSILTKAEEHEVQFVQSQNCTRVI